MYIPKSHTSGNRAQGLFDKDRFIYKSEENEYECPAGERLKFRTTMKQDGKNIFRYWASVCGKCAMKGNCMTGKERRVSRWEHEDVLDGAEDRLNANWEMMTIRSATVEHHLGRLNHGWDTRTS